MSDSIKNTFNEFINTHLNEQQRAAVLQKDGSLLVVAGAGSGKTRVITSRIAHLVINEQVNPRSIVALTFTNKAAGEMKERLVKTFNAQYPLPFIGTFHSYCLQLLRTNPSILEFQTFSILDSDDQLDLIKKISKQYALSKQTTPTQLCSFISQYKNKVHSNSTNSYEAWFPPYVKEIYLEYESEKSRAHCLDFDDLILYVLRILKKNSAFKQQFQERIRHILIDEYQDTNQVQHELLLTMSKNDTNVVAIDSLCTVGDEDQSIYSWRGATVANMLKFQQDFAPVTVIKIEQNYRSVQPILEAANTVIANNRLRNPKNLWSTLDAKNRVLAVSCQSGDQEASIIAMILKSIEGTQQLDKVAILYRTHFQSRTIEEALIHKAIPYRIIGGIRFYERKEIKDLLAYLRLVVNPYDKISLTRIINTPTRGLGQKFEEQLLHAWNCNPLFDFKQLITWMMQDEALDIGASKKSALQDFLSIFTDFTLDHDASFILDTILAKTQYISHLTHAFDPQEAQTKIENVQELVQAVIAFEKKCSKESKSHEKSTASLEEFLHEVALLQEKVEDHNAHNFVQMMTLHAAKGLEFDTVILAGLEEGLLPSTKSLNSNESLEEERRLMYVGMTRARQHLIICHAWSRFTFGQIVEQPPSRFLREIPKNLITSLDLDAITQSQAVSFLTKWLNGQQVSILPLAGPRKTIAAKKPTPIHLKKQSFDSWSKNQAVYHHTFGTGIVTAVEKAPDNDFYITALFKAGKKKVLGKFLQNSR